MISPAVRLKDLGKTSNLSLKLLCLTLIISIATFGSITFAADNPTDGFIQVSKNPNRTNPTSLNGSTVSGKVYIFVPSAGIDMASYYLDTRGEVRKDLMTSGKRNAPFDFAYTEKDKTARPFDTTELLDGKHTLIVKVRNSKTGKYIGHSAVFVVDNSVDVRPTTTTTIRTQPTTTKPSTTVATSTTRPQTDKPSNFVPAFAGDVAPGNVRWGSAVEGNGNPVTRHGADIGNRMGLRRTFYQWRQMDSMINSAKSDVAVGRLPWISIKPAGSWKSHGDGQHDSATKQMFVELGKINGPVWFTFHHEPEGGGSAGNKPDDNGGPAEWLRAQTRISEILRELQAQGLAKNVAFGPILMAYTFQKASGRNPDQWFKPGIWDFAGIDTYARGYDATSPMSEDGLTKARAFYGPKGLKIAIGEWAIRTQPPEETNRGEVPSNEEERIAGERVKKMYDDILKSNQDGKGAQIIAAAYFDTSLNSGPASFALTGNQLKVFRELIVLPTSLKANQHSAK